jgi:hypothetical protein
MKLRVLNVLKRVIYNCKSAQRLAIKKQESKLTPFEYLQYKIHLRGCSICREFEHFSRVINQFFSRERQEMHRQPKDRLSSEEKGELQRKVNALISSGDGPHL